MLGTAASSASMNPTINALYQQQQEQVCVNICPI
jgi:hypothetical protein